MSSLRMKTMLGLESASFLPIRFFIGFSFTEQPANKAVAVAALPGKKYKFDSLLTLSQE
jgi:hypothetical protein